MQVQIYKTKTKKLPGTHWYQVIENGLEQYKKIKNKTKRRPYVRSAYFKKEKIFLELFWNHLYEKANIRDKTRRLKYFSCAIELIENSKYSPTSKENPNKKSEILHRFMGSTPEDEVFFVQIKEEKKNGQKWLISIFPLDK
ncbi:MAG: hypothetical protein WC070_03210 [Candidatus Magasanikbacteria bacterium]